MPMLSGLFEESNRQKRQSAGFSFTSARVACLNLPPSSTSTKNGLGAVRWAQALTSTSTCQRSSLAALANCSEIVLVPTTLTELVANLYLNRYFLRSANMASTKQPRSRESAASPSWALRSTSALSMASRAESSSPVYSSTVLQLRRTPLTCISKGPWVCGSGGSKEWMSRERREMGSMRLETEALPKTGWSEESSLNVSIFILANLVQNPMSMFPICLLSFRLFIIILATLLNQDAGSAVLAHCRIELRLNTLSIQASDLLRKWPMSSRTRTLVCFPNNRFSCRACFRRSLGSSLVRTFNAVLGGGLRLGFVISLPRSRSFSKGEKTKEEDLVELKQMARLKCPTQLKRRARATRQSCFRRCINQEQIQMQVREMLKASLLRVEEALGRDQLLKTMLQDPTSSQFVDARVNEVYQLICNSERDRLLETLGEENQRLRGELARAEAEVAIMRRPASAELSSNQLEKALQEVVRLRTENEHLRSQNLKSPRFGGEFQAREQLRREQVERAVLQKQLAKVKEESSLHLSQLQEQSKKRNKEAEKQLQSKIEELKLKCYRLEIEGSEQRANFSSREADYRTALEEAVECKEELGAKYRKLEQLQEQSQTRVIRLERSKAELEQELETVRQFSYGLQASLKEGLERSSILREERERAEQQREELVHDIKVLKEANLKLELCRMKESSEMASWKSASASFEEKLKKERERLAVERAKVKDLEARLVEAESEWSQQIASATEKARSQEYLLKRSIAGLEAENERLKLREVMTVRERGQSQGENTREVEDEISIVKSQLQHLQVELQTQRTRGQQLAKDLAIAREESDRLREKLTHRSQELGARSAQLQQVLQKGEEEKQTSDRREQQQRWFMKVFKDELWGSVRRLLRGLREEMGTIRKEAAGARSNMALIFVEVRTQLGSRIDETTSQRIQQLQRFLEERERVDRELVIEKEKEVALRLEGECKSAMMALQNKNVQLTLSGQELANRIKLMQMESEERELECGRLEEQLRYYTELQLQTEHKVALFEASFEQRARVVSELESSSCRLREENMALRARLKASEAMYKQQLEQVRIGYSKENQQIWSTYEQDIAKLMRMAGSREFEGAQLQARRQRRQGEPRSLQSVEAEIEEQKQRLKSYRT